MQTEIEVEGVGTMRHLNDWQALRLRRIANVENRHIAMVAFGLGMTVHQFKKLSKDRQEAAWKAFNTLTGPTSFIAPEERQRPSLPRKGERVSIEKQIALGEQLISVKSKLPHGHFRLWVEDKSGLSYTQAMRLMRVAKDAQASAHLDQAA